MYGSPCLYLFTIQSATFVHIQMDMWVNPFRLLKYDPLLSWFPANGIGPTLCLSGDDLEKEHDWFWWHESKERGLKAMAAIYSSGDPPLHWHEGPIRKGHMDIWHLPISKMREFEKYAHFFKDVFHEVRMSTLLNMATEGEQWLGTCSHGSFCEDSDSLTSATVVTVYL